MSNILSHERITINVKQQMVKKIKIKAEISPGSQSWTGSPKKRKKSL